ncbi:hypothetical protein ACM66B_002052 [Microbotryomycetes sp. NB124-2]
MQRESPYPPVGPDGSFQQQQQQQYPPPNNGYYNQAPPPPQQQQQPYMHSQNYAPPPPQQQQQQQPYYNGNTGGGEGKWQQQWSQDYGNKTQKFDTMKPKWNDLIFALLFIAQFLGFVAISIIALRALGDSNGGTELGQSGGTSITLDSTTAYLLSIIAGTALVLSILLLMMVRAFTKIILEITLLLSVLLSVGYAIYLWIIRYWSGAIIFTIFAVISVLAYFPMRKRIPFSRELLLFVLKIAKHHKSTYIIALIGTCVQTAYSVYWSFSVIAIYQKWNPDAAGADTSGGTPSNATVIGLVIYSLFSFYWTSQFIVNYFLVIEAGIFGTYYFQGPTGKHVAWGAFKRASTYSMGSIAFGSLIVAILDLIRAGLQILQQYEAGQGDTIGAALACCAQCCIGCITWAVEFFNRYAYIEIALYGKPYIKAAKDTWNLFKDRGIDALINDCLVNNIWTFGSYAIGGLCTLFAFLYLTYANPSYVQNNDSIRAVVMLYAFLIGFLISHTLGYGALSSGVSTIFVGLAEDPARLAELDPPLFNRIQQTYPRVVTSV